LRPSSISTCCSSFSILSITKPSLGPCEVHTKFGYDGFNRLDAYCNRDSQTNRQATYIDELGFLGALCPSFFQLLIVDLSVNIVSSNSIKQKQKNFVWIYEFLFSDFQNFTKIKNFWQKLFIILSIYKHSLGSSELSEKSLEPIGLPVLTYIGYENILRNPFTDLPQIYWGTVEPRKCS